MIHEPNTKLDKQKLLPEHGSSKKRDKNSRFLYNAAGLKRATLGMVRTQKRVVDVGADKTDAQKGVVESEGAPKRASSAMKHIRTTKPCPEIPNRRKHYTEENTEEKYRRKLPASHSCKPIINELLKRSTKTRLSKRKTNPAPQNAPSTKQPSNEAPVKRSTTPDAPLPPDTPHDEPADARVDVMGSGVTDHIAERNQYNAQNYENMELPSYELPLTSPTTVNIETTNTDPIIKHVQESDAPRQAAPRQSISSLSPSKQLEICRQSAAQIEHNRFPGTPRSLKKVRLWSMLNIDCKVNGQTYKKIEKQLLFVRHAEGYHNSLFDEKKLQEAINIRDPELTPHGNCQVADLRKEVDVLIKSGVKIEKIVVSPMTRTLQTGWGTFSGHNIPFQACHMITEYSDAPCNYGTRKSQLEKMWPQVDFTIVPEIWWDEDESDETITIRAKRFREWLFRQPEKCMAIVSHAGFLHELLQEQFRNCELKRINWIHRSRRQARGH